MLQYQRIVIKLGTSVLTAGTPHLSRRRLLELVRQMAHLHEAGAEVIVVSSGAIGVGRSVLGDPDLGRNIPAKQMLAAVGQPHLMRHYADLFGIFGVQVAQVLLTGADLHHRGRYLNARDTLYSLLDQRVIAIVNENDTVSTDEIRVGDNDNLSALVANLIDADLLMLLTDQPGLFTSDPRTDPTAEMISLVEHIDEDVWNVAGGAGTTLGVGGMHTKIEAAQLATRSATTVVIAQGSRPDVITDLSGPDGEQIGTWFQPTATKVESRKRWMLSEPPRGTLEVDDGAAARLCNESVSLLPVGVTGVSGNFERGVIVRVTDPDGTEIARGLVNYSADEMQHITGLRSSEIADRLGYTYGDEAIHRENMVML